jgi:hypothetical protein
VHVAMELAALFAAVTMAGCGPAIDDEAELKVAMQEIMTDITAASTASSDALPQINPDSRARGEAGRFARVFKAYMIRSVRDRRAYHEAWKAWTAADLTSPIALSRPDGFQHAHAALTDLRGAIQQYVDANQRSLATLRHDIDSFPPRISASFEAGLNGSLSEDGGIEGIMKFERRAIDEMEHEVDDIEHSHGAWRPSGDNFQFDSDADVDAFNAHQQAIRQILDEENAALAAMRARQAGRIERGNHLLDTP